MAKGLNKQLIIGNLTRDPETRYTQDGKAVANFTVAVNEEWKDKNTGEKKSKAEFIRCVCFGKLAEICGQYLQKGKLVYAEGKQQTRSYDKEGVTHYITETVINDMQMLDSKGQTSGQSQGQSYPAPDNKQPFNDSDGDLPF